MTSMEQRLSLFKELMISIGIRFWQFDVEGALVETSCEDPEFFVNLWKLCGHNERAVSCWRAENGVFPVYLSDEIGLIWLAEPRMMGETLAGLYVIGPVLSSGIAERSLETSLRSIQISGAWQSELKDRLLSLPVNSPLTIPQYGIMLHRCVTGETISAADVRVPVQPQLSEAKDDFAPKKRRGIYESELIMLKTIASGMMDDETLLRVHGEVGNMSRGDPLRQAKNNVISEIALISRAAIEGGLPEEVALEMADTAVLAAEDCRAPLNAWQVLPDFAYAVSARIHQMRSANRSRLVTVCEDYFARNLSLAVDYAGMARELGYSRNYLAARYRKETGKTLAQELMRQRIERSLLMLVSKEKTIQEIAEELCFSSPSHFSSAFRKATGKTPGEYRNERQKG